MKQLIILSLILATAAPVQATKWARPGDLQEPRSENQCTEEPCSLPVIPFFRGETGDES